MFANDFNSQTSGGKFLFRTERNRKENSRREREKSIKEKWERKKSEIKRVGEKVSSQLLYVWSVLDRCSNCSSLSIRVQKVCDTQKSVSRLFLLLSWSRGWRRKFERERGRERVSERQTKNDDWAGRGKRDRLHIVTHLFFWCASNLSSSLSLLFSLTFLQSKSSTLLQREREKETEVSLTPLSLSSHFFDPVICSPLSIWVCFKLLLLKGKKKVDGYFTHKVYDDYFLSFSLLHFFLSLLSFSSLRCLLLPSAPEELPLSFSLKIFCIFSLSFFLLFSLRFFCIFFSCKQGVHNVNVYTHFHINTH